MFREVCTEAANLITGDTARYPGPLVRFTYLNRTVAKGDELMADESMLTNYLLHYNSLGFDLDFSNGTEDLLLKQMGIAQGLGFGNNVGGVSAAGIIASRGTSPSEARAAQWCQITSHCQDFVAK